MITEDVWTNSATEAWQEFAKENKIFGLATNRIDDMKRAFIAGWWAGVWHQVAQPGD